MSAPPNFDKLARPYRWLEYLSFGPYLHRTRTYFLPQLTTCRHALVLGDGDGRFTAALLRTNPHIHIHAIDASSAMLLQLTKYARLYTSRLTTEQADLRHWTPKPGQHPGKHYDLIATHFLLDCLTTEEITHLANRLAPALAPSAQWLVSDFAIPPTPFGHFIARPLVTLLYKTFRLLTDLNVNHLPDHSEALIQSHWTLQRHHPHLRGLLISQLFSLTKPNSFGG